jgi:diguanylate cyclase (GGDEF)-like protein
VLGRRQIRELCESAVAREGDRGGVLSLVVCALDGFKRIGDELGDQRRDELLAVAAEAVSAGVREGDAVGSLGGEFFAVVLPGADELEALEIAERVRERIARASEDEGTPLTATCGVATLGAEGRVGELLRAAADALSTARVLGSDRTVAAASGNGFEKRVVFSI